MQRIFESERMADEERARYAQADFFDSNRRFLAHFQEKFPDFCRGLVLDVGCGPGDVPLRFARRYAEATVHGLDSSAAMLRYAQNALALAPDLRSRVRFVQGRLPEAVLPRRSYDAIISNSLLHRLPETASLWQALSELGRPGACVCMMDLHRPGSEAQARELVERHAGDKPEPVKRDFLQSLRAAFKVEEIRQQLTEAKLLLSVETCDDHHLLIWGALPA